MPSNQSQKLVNSNESEDLHLWIILDHEHISDVAIDHCRNHFLDSSERKRESTFIALPARRQFVIGRTLLRMAVAHHLGQAAADLRFQILDGGKPILAAEQNRLPAIEFNLSHTTGAIVVGITKGRRVGVDVEFLNNRPISAQLVSRFFDKAECVDIMSAPECSRSKLFYQHWSLKEAYVKGAGTSTPNTLRSIIFKLSGDPITASESSSSAPVTKWQFEQYFLTTRHVLSVCLEGIPLQTNRRIFHYPAFPQTIHPIANRCYYPDL